MRSTDISHLNFFTLSLLPPLNDSLTKSAPTANPRTESVSVIQINHASSLPLVPGPQKNTSDDGNDKRSKTGYVKVSQHIILVPHPLDSSEKKTTTDSKHHHIFNVTLLFSVL